MVISSPKSHLGTWRREIQSTLEQRWTWEMTCPNEMKQSPTFHPNTMDLFSPPGNFNSIQNLNPKWTKSDFILSLRPYTWMLVDFQWWWSKLGILWLQSICRALFILCLVIEIIPINHPKLYLFALVRHLGEDGLGFFAVSAPRSIEHHKPFIMRRRWLKRI